MRKNIERFKNIFLIILFVNVFIASNLYAKNKHEIIFYPTSANWSEEDNVWEVPIHGYAYSNHNYSPIRYIGELLGKIYAWLEHREDIEEVETNEVDEDDPEDIADLGLLKKRLRPFFLHGKYNHKMFLNLNGQSWGLPATDKYGHTLTTLKLDLGILPETINKPRRIEFEAFDDDLNMSYSGHFYLVPPSGITIVSDIDDTIKFSEVLDREELVENTLLYPFLEIKGMADWYSSYEDCGASFHYVSKSPWQLFNSLSKFLKQTGFPQGSYYLRYQKPYSLKRWRKIKSISKEDYIRDLMKRFPGRKFILIGDSTQKDPKTYSSIASEFPNQVEHIYIRKVTREDNYELDSLKGVDLSNAGLWTLFTQPDESMKYQCIT